jgi:hypothetical protein
MEARSRAWTIHQLEVQHNGRDRYAHVAIDILSAPAMSAEAERVFSRARRTITFDREKLKAESVSHYAMNYYQKAGVVF